MYQIDQRFLLICIHIQKRIKIEVEYNNKILHYEVKKSTLYVFKVQQIISLSTLYDKTV